MKKTNLLTQLEDLCKRLSIIIKYDRFFGRGGYCRLRNQAYFIINKRLSSDAKEQIFLNELRAMDIDTSQASDKIQTLIESQ
ncbi:hypothetical protein JXB22_08685 [candidate division WOR-3 bacterium]|nr:hypothetical protein [candidate division WOR-3 bacterium]